MVATAYEQILIYGKARQYKETAQLLQVSPSNAIIDIGRPTINVTL